MCHEECKRITAEPEANLKLKGLLGHKYIRKVKRDVEYRPKLGANPTE